MIYGYARVSTEAQDLTGSTAQLKATGCQKISREKITGTTGDRPQLKKLMSSRQLTACLATRPTYW
jgi:DNA invertase Pin-like site-specific DNA recombinase